jgi:hypothetical protein
VYAKHADFLLTLASFGGIDVTSHDCAVAWPYRLSTPPRMGSGFERLLRTRVASPRGFMSVPS